MDNPWIGRILWTLFAIAFCYAFYLFLASGGYPPQNPELSPELNRELERIFMEKKY